MPVFAESLVFVNIMYFIYNVVKNMIRGLITIYIDQRRAQKFIGKEIKKILECALAELSSHYEVERLISKL